MGTQAAVLRIPNLFFLGGALMLGGGRGGRGAHFLKRTPQLMSHAALHCHASLANETLGAQGPDETATTARARFSAHTRERSFYELHDSPLTWEPSHAIDVTGVGLPTQVACSALLSCHCDTKTCWSSCEATSNHRACPLSTAGRLAETDLTLLQ